VQGDGDVRLDVEGLEFMDSAGISALIKVCRSLGDRGRVVLRSPGGEVAKVLELIGAEAFPNLVIDGDGGQPRAVTETAPVSTLSRLVATAGETAHYVLANGDHRPAVIVGVEGNEACTLSIVLDPTDQDTDLPAMCRRDGDGKARARLVPYDQDAHPGTWHHPER
jgi:hypothetical protein